MKLMSSKKPTKIPELSQDAEFDTTTSVQVQILPETVEPVEEVIENLDETVKDDSLAPKPYCL